MSERPEQHRKWSEKRLRKVFGAARNRAPRVFEGKTVRETRAAVESEGEGNSESFRNLRRGSLREKMSERPERSRKRSEKRLRKASGPARNRAPWVFERKIALETQAVMEMEAEEWSESLRSRAPWVFERKIV